MVLTYSLDLEKIKTLYRKDPNIYTVIWDDKLKSLKVLENKNIKINFNEFVDKYYSFLLSEYNLDNTIMSSLLPKNEKEKQNIARDRLMSGYWFFYISNNSILGFCNIREIGNNSSCFLHGLYIDINHRNEKIGTKLLLHCIYKCKNDLNCKKLILHVFNNNIPAKKLYEKLGFKLNEKSIESLNKEIFFMSGNMNENTFVGLTYYELSQEGFGLPSIRNLRAPSEKELFNSPIVKAAAAKAKAYGIQKGYTNSIPVSEKDKEAYIKAVIWKRALTISGSELKVISKNVEFVKVNGVVLVKCKCNLTTAEHVVLGFMAVTIGMSLGFVLPKKVVPHSVINGVRAFTATGNPVLGGVAAAGTAAIEGGILGFIGTSFFNYIANVMIKGNKKNNLSIFASWVAFKNKDNKVVLKRFCNAIIDPDNKYVFGQEDLSISDETDEVSMTDLVEDETTVEEDAGKDSEVKDAKPTEAETEHNEEASAGGILTGDNKNELEVKETSEEALGITDYDLYSEDEYKSLEGVFDPDDFE